MASGGSGGVSVPALWSEVNRYGQNSDFTRALKTVNKSKCRGCRGCREDAAGVRRATPPHSAEGIAASSGSAPSPGAGRCPTVTGGPSPVA